MSFISTFEKKEPYFIAVHCVRFVLIHIRTNPLFLITDVISRDRFLSCVRRSCNFIENTFINLVNGVISLQENIG